MILSLTFIWFAALLIVLGAEMLLSTIYLLAVALGLLSGGICALLDLDLSWQCLIAACMMIAGAFFARRFRHRTKAQAVYTMDAGQTVKVEHTNSDGSAKVNYRGAQWQAKAARGALKPGSYLIKDIQCNILILEPASNSDFNQLNHKDN